MREEIGIRDIQSKVHATAVEKGWWEDGKDPSRFPALLMLVVSEVSEALEEYRNGHKLTDAYYGENFKPEGVPIELADAVIRIMDMCEAYGIDLEAAIKTKIAYNKSRPHRHGGKVC